MKLHIKPPTAVFSVVVIALGVAMICCAPRYDPATQPFKFNVLCAGGAAIVAAALSLLVSRVFEPPPLDEVAKDIAELKEAFRLAHQDFAAAVAALNQGISNSLLEANRETQRLLTSVSKSPFLTADEQKLEIYRGVFHGYLWSNWEGNPVWKYRVFDFTKAHVPGHLHALVPVKVPDGSTEVYSYEGFIIDKHILLIGVGALRNEPPVIQIFPCGCERPQGGPLTGLAFFRTPDGHQVVAPTMLSLQRLANRTEIGPVDESESADLMKKWDDGFKTLCQLHLPPSTIRPTVSLRKKQVNVGSGRNEKTDLPEATLDSPVAD